jgi:hypothetical protein
LVCKSNINIKFDENENPVENNNILVKRWERELDELKWSEKDNNKNEIGNDDVRLHELGYRFR